MCPLRLILVFLSATLAGYFAWKSIRSSSPTLSDDADGRRSSDGDSNKSCCFRARKVIGDGFWLLLDMASGRYLWRMMKDE
ncbi:tRNA (adenine57-N1/adenine58-N1)-methyltransferase [Apostasia shenzhenica]|uniref:tRNA (Adenine57-N1/adenine58-N1)-methyltransferase n=1 Tax=Apostasia shenzhenica TaxID=1088818 RepID=A0A2I0A343_9ASPA|nr:tRNA (adenine57-N1/adenine58-N1)-methyltransferase [Apostasia shenzhenica]